MNKLIAITGSTGGLGSEMVKCFVKQGYDLILLNRSKTKTEQQIKILKQINNNVSIEFYQVDLNIFSEVQKLCSFLENKEIHCLILNAAIYNVDVTKSDTGYNNIFQVNFISPFYILKRLKEKNNIKHFFVIGSIAYKFGEYIESDIDYSNHTKINKIYGNSKRFLMFSLYKEFENDTRLTIGHPGVVYTNMTNHYNKWINWLIIFGIKMFFPKAKKMAKMLVKVFDTKLNYLEWIGPNIFNIWGRLKIKKIKDVKESEITMIHDTALKIYGDLYEDN